jgi:hypothetical protein
VPVLDTTCTQVNDDGGRYKQELRRNFSMIEVFGIAFSIMVSTHPAVPRPHLRYGGCYRSPGLPARCFCESLPKPTYHDYTLSDTCWIFVSRKHLTIPQGLLPSIASTLAYSIPAGPVGLVWGWFLASMFIFIVGMAMADLGSAMPTSGGLCTSTILSLWASLCTDLNRLVDTLLLQS